MMRSCVEIGIAGTNLLAVSCVTCDLIQTPGFRDRGNVSHFIAGTLALATAPVVIQVIRKVAKAVFPATVFNSALLNAGYVGLRSLGVIFGMYGAYQWHKSERSGRNEIACVILATTVIGAPITIELITKVVQAYRKPSFI